MSLWVAGTDTGVGKTVVSALILARYASSGPIAYWKPVSTGDGQHDRDAIERWLGGDVAVLPEAYRLSRPLSPHLAARLEGAAIAVERILEALVAHAAADPRRNLIVEAAGGLLVPLDDAGRLEIDLIAETALPAVLVARSTLGTINHTLLSLEALRARRIPIAGVVVNGPPEPENRRAIERFGRVRVIGEVAALDGIWSGAADGAPAPSARDIRRAAAAFDAEGALAEYLGEAA
jgi:malonyl-CoA O-methyltransferase